MSGMQMFWLLKFFSHANAQVNNVIRQNLKSLIKAKYHGLCKDSITIPTSVLFGDNLLERLREMGQVVWVSCNPTTPARRCWMPMDKNLEQASPECKELYAKHKRPTNIPCLQKVNMDEELLDVIITHWAWRHDFTLRRLNNAFVHAAIVSCEMLQLKMHREVMTSVKTSLILQPSP